MEERIIELETKFSFQEDLVNELNATVVQQQRQLDEMRSLIMQLQNLVTTSLDAPADD